MTIVLFLKVWRNLISLSLFAWACCVFAQTPPQRFALVIGNSHYGSEVHGASSASPPTTIEFDNLNTPGQDADDVGAMLRQMGYQVTVRKDLDFRSMNDEINQFATNVLNADKNSAVLIYYAGHGVSLGGQNFLIPARTILPADRDFLTRPVAVQQRQIDSVAIRADNIMELFGGRPTGRTIMIIDACRKDPWQEKLHLFRGENTTGLSPMYYDGSSIVAFSASPGKNASDTGNGKNSIFATAFLSFKQDANRRFDDFWGDVTDAVSGATAGAQQPWISGVLGGHFCLATCGSESSVSAPIDRTTQQIERLYAPLYQALVQGDLEWQEFTERFFRQFGRRSPLLNTIISDASGNKILVPLPLSDAEWHLWMEGVHKLFKPRNDLLFSIINDNSSLIEGGVVSDCFKQFFIHRDAFNISLEDADADSTVRTWNPSHPFPTCFVPEVENTLKSLEARQAGATLITRK